MTPTISNGFRHTNSYWECTLPILATDLRNAFAEPVERPDDAPENQCDCCAVECQHVSETGVPLYGYIFPCILQGLSARARVTFPCIHTDGEPGVSRIVACDVKFRLCDRCSKRAFSVMDVSDHLTTGEDWWEMVVELRSVINDEQRWQRWAGGDEIISRATAKTLCILDHAVSDEKQQGPFSVIPRDVLYVIAPHIKENVRNTFATKIQALYRGWRVRMYTEANRWSRCSPMRDTLYKAVSENKWTVCDDCGMRRMAKDVSIMPGCADSGGCCYKVVCSEACCYQCPECRFDNFVKYEDKNADGTPTYFDCRCGSSYELHEEWWGISMPEHERRYG